MKRGIGFFSGTEEDTLMVFADDEIDFPVANALLSVHDGIAWFNVDAIGNLPSAIPILTSFPALSAALAKMSMELYALGFVSIDKLINGFHGPSGTGDLLQASRWFVLDSSVAKEAGAPILVVLQQIVFFWVYN